MDFDFTDTGTGPVLLFLPGSYSTHAVWKGVQNALTGSYRVVTTSLPGYGGTPEIRADTVRDMAQMVAFVVNVIDRIGAPVHLVGHSYGGLVAFAADLSDRVTPLSVMTFEGNPVFSRHSGDERPWMAEVLRINARFEDAFAAAAPDAAEIIIDYWGQPGMFAALPSQIQDYCRATAGTNILDWRCASGFRPHVADYAAIDMPCSIVRGQFANPAIIDISAEIARHVPNARSHVVPGSGHFLISTHPAECAGIIDRHMADFAESARVSPRNCGFP